MEIREGGEWPVYIITFNSKQEDVMTIFPKNDTMLYQYNSAGQVSGLIQIKKGVRTKVGTPEYDSLGYLTRLNFGTGAGRGYFLYRNNEKGLVEEIRKYAIEDSDEEYIGKSLFKYEFYNPL